MSNESVLPFQQLYQLQFFQYTRFFDQKSPLTLFSHVFSVSFFFSILSTSKFSRKHKNCIHQICIYFECITMSIQEISSVHKFILTIQQNLRSRTKWPYPFLTTSTSKIVITFSFPEFVPACKKSFWRYSQFQIPVIRLTTPIFDHHFLLYVNLYHHAKNQAILLICSGDMVD